MKSELFKFSLLFLDILFEIIKKNSMNLTEHFTIFKWDYLYFIFPSSYK